MKSTSLVIALALISCVPLVFATPVAAQPSTVTGNGLLGEYFQYRNVDFPFSAADKRFEISNDLVDKKWTNSPYSGVSEGKKVTYSRMATVSFANGKGQAMVNYMSTSKMAVRWSGSLHPAGKGSYMFRFRGDGGVSFYLMDPAKKVILHMDKWSDNTKTTTSSKVNMEAKTEYPLFIEYFNAGGTAQLVFEWSNDGGKKWTPVPKQVLKSSDANRTVSVKALNEAYLQTAIEARNKLNTVLDKNYLLDPVIRAAQETALSMLGARTKKLIDTAAAVYKDGWAKTLANQLGKVALGPLFVPVKKAETFIKIFSAPLQAAKLANQTDPKRAVIFLTMKENPNASITDLPKEYQNGALQMMTSASLESFLKQPDWLINNIGKLAGTINTQQREALSLLIMTSIAEFYIFQYTDYIQILLK